MKNLLIVAHCPSPNTQKLAGILENASISVEFDNLAVKRLSPFDTTELDIQSADGILLFTTENFGYMSGALKDMFDRIFYPCLENTPGMPYCLCVRAGEDGTGTVSAVESIAKGMKWSKAQAPLVLRGTSQTSFEEKARQYAMTFAAGLDTGIY